MTLVLGTRIGPYEIVSMLGAGGMGEVYKARDVRLDRFVAIKILRAEATADPERKRRFVQEAKAASALNHPNIVTIHEIGSADSVDYIVMEYVAGNTLDRLIGSGLKVRDLLDYATQAADALAKAHGAGILHRDLKPSNMMVTSDGRVKILDFGLAKLSPTAPNSSETTLVADPTRTADGHVMGTPAYMSPEQAEGKSVDTRSDIFSFGAMLYEMATGVRAFQGDSTASTLAAVLTTTPTLPSVRVPNLPRELERIIVRCLRKEPSRRFQVMADLVVELEEIKTESSDIQPIRVSPKRARWPWVAAAVVGLAMVIAAARSVLPHATTRGSPTVVSLTAYRGEEGAPSLSPDGTQVAFVWDGEEQNNFDIYVKPVDAVMPLRLTSNVSTDVNPVWSPSGREIAFVRLQADGGASVFVTPPIPGSERKVADAHPLGDPMQFSLTWTPDGRSLVVPGSGPADGQNGLFLIGVESGEQRAIVTTPTTTTRYVRAAVSPTGDTIAYSGCVASACDVWVQPVTSGFSAHGAPRRLTDLHGTITGLTWMPDGRSMIVGATTSQSAFANLWKIQVSGGDPVRLDWLGSQVYEPSVSKNGRRLVATKGLGNVRIWQFDVSTPGVPPKEDPISSTLPDLDPDFSPDGSRIAFSSARSGREQEIWIAQIDGTGEMPLTRGAAGRNRGTPRWSHDGKRIAFDSSSGDGVRRAYVIDAAGGAPRLASDYHANYPSWSHDDKWIYFGSNRSRRVEVWRVPSDGGTPEQVTRDGGNAPRESPDGRTLYYRRGSTLYARLLTDGAEYPVVEGVGGSQTAYSTFGDEIFYVVQPDTGHPKLFELRAMQLVTRKERLISRFDASEVSCLAIAPNGKKALLTVFTSASDLILVDNFE